MRIQGKHYETIRIETSGTPAVSIIDQTGLPFAFRLRTLRSFDEVFSAIRDMRVRGAPLIGVAAACGIWLGLEETPSGSDLKDTVRSLCERMGKARPTAVNLHCAVKKMETFLGNTETLAGAREMALTFAENLKRSEISACRAIGKHGFPLIKEIAEKKKGAPVNILTHCNAGWLACVDWGTATAPVYKAHREGIPVHVWVDETRPRLQGSRLTAFELKEEGVPHTVITDNAGGHLMQHGMVDIVLVGSDRTTRCGDVCNKIGTYLKALAAYDNHVPFYAALPVSSIDTDLCDGAAEIPIEERGGDEVIFAEGKGGRIRLLAEGSPVANFGFDVTPARLVTGLITEYGICRAEKAEILRLLQKGEE